MLALLLVALSVGLDNFGAAAAMGVAGVDGHLRLRIAVIFGVFEAAMPVVGLWLGDWVGRRLGDKASLLAGCVLCLVGAYAVVSALRGGGGHEREPRSGTGRIVALGAALSIDNVAVGFALGAYHVNVLLAALVIASVSVVLTLIGLEMGTRIGRRLGGRSELVGGALLILVGGLVAGGVL